jgi:hypothetical protein
MKGSIVKALVLVFCIWIASCGALLAEIDVGSSKDDVLSEWGRPSAHSGSSSKETLVYKDGREVQLQDGKVVEVLYPSIKKTPSTTPAPQRQQTAVLPPATATQKATTNAVKTVAQKTDVKKTAPPISVTNAVKTTAQKTNAVAASPVSVPPPPPKPATNVPGTSGQTIESEKAVGVAATEPSPSPAQSAKELVEYYRNTTNNYEKRKVAAILIGQKLGPAAADLFIADITNKDCAAPIEMVKFLKPIKDPRSVEPMMRVLETADYSTELRRQICIALGEIGDPKILNMFMIRFKLEPDEMVQIEMANAMDGITGQKHYYDVGGRLKWLQQNHPEWIKGPKAGPISFKNPDRFYLKTTWYIAAGFAASLYVLYRLWKRWFSRRG